MKSWPEIMPRSQTRERYFSQCLAVLGDCFLHTRLCPRQTEEGIRSCQFPSAGKIQPWSRPRTLLRFRSPCPWPRRAPPLPNNLPRLAPTWRADQKVNSPALPPALALPRPQPRPIPAAQRQPGRKKHGSANTWGHGRTPSNSRRLVLRGHYQA